MRIASFLDRRDVTAALPLADKRTVLAALTDLVAGHHPELNAGTLLDVLMKREALRSTGIEQGVAFPHGRVPGLKGLRAGFGRSREGVNFDAFDGRPTHFFFMLLIPEGGEGEHLRALARLNRLFQDEDFRQRLLNVDDADTLYQVLTEQDTGA